MRMPSTRLSRGSRGSDWQGLPERTFREAWFVVFPGRRCGNRSGHGLRRGACRQCAGLLSQARMGFLQRWPDEHVAAGVPRPQPERRLRSRRPADVACGRRTRQAERQHHHAIDQCQRLRQLPHVGHPARSRSRRSRPLRVPGRASARLFRHHRQRLAGKRLCRFTWIAGRHDRTAHDAPGRACGRSDDQRRGRRRSAHLPHRAGRRHCRCQGRPGWAVQRTRDARRMAGRFFDRRGDATAACCRRRGAGGALRVFGQRRTCRGAAARPSMSSASTT